MCVRVRGPDNLHSSYYRDVFVPIDTRRTPGEIFPGFPSNEKRETAIERKFLLLLAQLLLAVAHLQKNLVSHCAISSGNVYVSDKGQRVVLGDFGQALNLRPKNLDVLRKSLGRLSASKTRKLSPEAEQSLLASCSSENVTSPHVVQNLEESFSMSDSFAVGALFYDLFTGKEKQFSDTANNPFIHSLSFRCNHLLQKLVARDPSDRFSALQGAMSCFVLLFGPRASEISCTSECLRWLVSESLELYLNPVLRDSATGFSSNREGNCHRRLHYAYLVSASPELVFSSCKFFNNE
jgi:serine/threonine protein kinase